MKPNPLYAQGYVVTDSVFATPVAASAPFSSPPSFTPTNEAGAKEYLKRYNWPEGLKDSFIRGVQKMPIRFFVCDDSGSMVTNDGKKMVVNGTTCKKIGCSRWSELTYTLTFHAQLAHAANAPTEFRLLNGAPPIMIGDGNDPDGTKLASFLALLEDSPSGGTPLCRHIHEIVTKIRVMEPQLRASGKKACIVVLTDGESSDGDIATALRPLKDLPCWVVIRLCTDEDRIIDYWNNIDQDLELDMDVLDDLYGEAEEVHQNNPWLTYGEPIHRLREFGVPMKEFDLLDEARLSPEQIKIFCHLLLGGDLASYPNPQTNKKDFDTFVRQRMSDAGQIPDPRVNKFKNWIRLSKVQSSGCVIS